MQYFLWYGLFHVKAIKTGDKNTETIVADSEYQVGVSGQSSGLYSHMAATAAIQDRQSPDVTFLNLVL